MLFFADDQGGSLAVIAAGMANLRGQPARALTSAAVALAPEVEPVLREVGAAPVKVAPVAEAEGGAALVWVGRNREIDAWLYEGPAETPFGPTTLERLAIARIARDRCDRYLDRLAG